MICQVLEVPDEFGHGSLEGLAITLMLPSLPTAISIGTEEIDAILFWLKISVFRLCSVGHSAINAADISAKNAVGSGQTGLFWLS